MYLLGNIANIQLWFSQLPCSLKQIEIIIKIQLECNAISGYSFIEKIRSQLEIIQSAGDHVLDTHP